MKPAECGFPMLTKKVTKRRGAEKVCPQQDCNFVDSMDEGDDEQQAAG